MLRRLALFLLPAAAAALAGFCVLVGLKQPLTFPGARSADGCPTCECNPPPVCEPVLCDLYCEHGFAVDPTTGCETCSSG